MERDPMEMALSTDIVMDIVLSHLKVRDLLSCRLASKFWNKTASSVLRRRSTMIKNISKTKTLTELGRCLKQSSDFPFVGLEFDEPWKLRTVGLMKFLRNYGTRFTSLYLSTWSGTRLEDLALFINHLPRLSILTVGWFGLRRSRVVLLDSAAGQDDDGSILNLSSLHTFRIYSPLNEDVLRKVCTAASPSLRIECLTSYEILKGLKRVGKLPAVSDMGTYPDDDGKASTLRTAELLSTELPTLNTLNFTIDSFLSLDGLKKILTSSQHTLKELRLQGICPSQFSSECPVLPKLTTLSLRIRGQSYEYVFQGRQGHKFPALKELELDINVPRSANLSDGLFIVPSLKTIDLDGYVAENGMEDLARSFPNVIEIRLKYKDYELGSSGVSGPNDIWSVRAFEFLEKLRIWHYTVERPTKIFGKSRNFKHFINLEKFKMMNMDSFLTGIPFGICENLRKNNQQNLMHSPFNEILRDGPSILQLKNLKELIVCVKFEKGLEELPEDPPFISMVSVWYALQMMLDLQAKFVYEYDSPSWGFVEEDRDKAVRLLKAAFKHVQPYVKLEPFFY